MKNARALIANSGFIIVLALILGLLTGFSFYPKEMTYVSLGTIMTLSLTKIDFEKLKKTGTKEIGLPVLLVYLYSPLFVLAPAHVLINNTDYLNGLVILALVPSAVGVVAFSGILKGDNELALAGTASVYLSSLVLTPLLSKAIIGEGVKVVSILGSLVILVVIPLVLSRILVMWKIDEKAGQAKADVINILFFILIFNIVGSNRSAFFIDSYNLFSISLICFLKTFVAGSIIFIFLTKMGHKYEDSMTYTLFGAFKNGGLAVALSMVLFSPAATVPAAISVVFDFGSLTYYQYVFRNKYGKREVRGKG